MRRHRIAHGAPANRCCAEELARSRRIAASESALAELTRDYEVNRDIYQDLLKRRENARVSMNLDRASRGLTFRIQDPATMPLRPTGSAPHAFRRSPASCWRWSCRWAAVRRGRASIRACVRRAQLERHVGVPVLATLPLYATPRERSADLHPQCAGRACLFLGRARRLRRGVSAPKMMPQRYDSRRRQGCTRSCTRRTRRPTRSTSRSAPARAARSRACRNRRR